MPEFVDDVLTTTGGALRDEQSDVCHMEQVAANKSAELHWMRKASERTGDIFTARALHLHRKIV